MAEQEGQEHWKLKQSIQSCAKTQLEAFLSSPQNLPFFRDKSTQEICEPDLTVDALLACDVCDPWMDLSVERHHTSGEILEISEVTRDGVGMTARNSLSFQRPVVASNASAKGDPSNLPFWPGGFELPVPVGMDTTPSAVLLKDGGEFLKVPPGFKSGVDFGQEGSLPMDILKAENEAEDYVVGLSDIVSKGLAFPWVSSSDAQPTVEKANAAVKDKREDLESSDELEGLEFTITKVPEDQPVSQLKSAVRHHWAVAVDLSSTAEEYKTRVPHPVTKWPFELDPFQKQAIIHIESQENVFVAAHTSAGKTVVAEYAIALSAKHHTKTLYTSPLKALSNQKFRDFRTTFGNDNIGLLTGDVQIKTDAPCLIMTTEILRSMLYNGSDIIRDVEWVIFDEVHYVNDTERGVVWEETLIMLPDHVGIIMLSATVPNAMEFADWIGRTKKKPIHIISTTKRPVPLEHFLFTGNSTKTADELFKIVNEHGQFQVDGYRSALMAKKSREAKSSDKRAVHSVKAKEERNIWMTLVKMLQKKDKLPVVAFTFSRARCDNNADSLTTLDLTTSAEKHFIHSFFMASVSRLKGTDKELPQVLKMQDLLKRGIAVHHSGILPLIKEIVELLFQRGLVRLLFATETFAMGVNMPARTVVFDSIRKHDGQRMRELYSGEYVQMAGRAGRRGLDSTGMVILLCKGDVPESSELHRMILGKPIRLESKFRVTYGMILNLARVDTLRVEDMLKRSYAEIDSAREMPDRAKQLEAVKLRLQSIIGQDDTHPPAVDKYYATCARLRSLAFDTQRSILKYQGVWKFLTPGRVLLLTAKGRNWEVGALLESTAGKRFIVLMLCEKGKEGLEHSDFRALEAPDVLDMHFWQGNICLSMPEEISFTIMEVPQECLYGIARTSLTFEANKVLEDFKRRQIPRFRGNPPSQAAIKAIEQVQSYVRDMKSGAPELLHPISDLKINDFEIVQKIREGEMLRKSMEHFDCTDDPQFEKHLLAAKSKADLNDSLSELQYQLSEASLSLLPDFKQREEVLMHLGYLNGQGVVQHKGRVACQLNAHEVFLTELLHENVFADCAVEETVALLSSLVFQQSRCSEPNLTEHLQEIENCESDQLIKERKVTAMSLYHMKTYVTATSIKYGEMGKKKMEAVAIRLAQLEQNCGVDTSVGEYLKEFHWGLTEVVYEWARQMPFAEITQLTDVQEGLIVRCIQRLDELCKDVKSAAGIIGNKELSDTMARGSELIRRDIVFAASLYID